MWSSFNTMLLIMLKLTSDYFGIMTTYRVEIREEAERRGAVEPEWQEVLQLSMTLWLEGSTRQRKGAQEWVGLVLGESTYRKDNQA